MTGTIFDVKEMAVHDGPGIRTTVFFKGCPLRCRWCHNPEGLSSTPQLMYKQSRCRHCGLCQRPCSHPDCRRFGRCLHICPDDLLTVTGEEIEAVDLVEKLKRSAEPMGNHFGGFTFSGGEPLMQPDFLLEIIHGLSGYHLCMETSGFARQTVFSRVIETLDFVIMDLKLADSKTHKEYTGVDNEKILANFKCLQKSGKPYLIRTPLIPGITDMQDNLTAIKNIIGDSPWELLPYNHMAGAKYEMLGLNYEL